MKFLPPKADKKGPNKMGVIKTQMRPLSKASPARATTHGQIAGNSVMLDQATKSRKHAPGMRKARRGGMY